MMIVAYTKGAPPITVTLARKTITLIEKIEETTLGIFGTQPFSILANGLPLST
jgi:hypothetical protein